MNYNIFITSQLQIINLFPVLPISWLNKGLLGILKIYYGKGWLYHLSRLFRYPYLKLYHQNSWPKLNCWFSKVIAAGWNRKKKKFFFWPKSPVFHSHYLAVSPHISNTCVPLIFQCPFWSLSSFSSKLFLLYRLHSHGPNWRVFYSVSYTDNGAVTCTHQVSP